MKKLILFTLPAAMLLALSACSGGEQSQTASAPGQQTSSAADAISSGNENASAGNANNSADETQSEMIPGKLYQLGDPDKEPVVKGVKLDGNQIGSTLNDREPADDNIRFVFALGEWVYVYPDTEKKSGLSVYVTEHQKDAETITDSFLAALSDDTPKAELIAPEEDGSEWGAFYLHQETFAAGDYDLIFADGLKPVARVLLKFYPESELNEKTDAELEAIMSDARKAASGS